MPDQFVHRALLSGVSRAAARADFQTEALTKN